MRIVIDMQGAQTGSRLRGIGRYTLSLTQAMARNSGNHEIILALNGLFPDTIAPIRAAFRDLIPRSHIRVWRSPGPVREADIRNRARREIAECVREAFLNSLQPDIILVSSLFEGLGDDAVTSIGALTPATPVAVILYDLIPFLNPDTHFQTNPVHKHYLARKMRSLKNASGLLAISEYSRQEALQNLGGTRSITNISGACDPCLANLSIRDQDSQEVCRSLGISRPFILYTGGADERKNLTRLIEAYALLPSPQRSAYQLVLAGHMPQSSIQEFRRDAKRARLAQNDVVFTGYISDANLVTLYRSCALFVFPSLYEGFGLPPLEAMACGAPVIAANTTSLPEIVGLEAALFDPTSVQSIRDKMISVLTDEVFRAQLTAHGRAQALRFSWDKNAQTALRALEALTIPRLPALPAEIRVMRTSPPAPEFARILVLKLDHMGDFVLALPALRMLRAKYPYAHIDIIVGSWNEYQARETGLFRHIFTFDFFKKTSAAAPSIDSVEFATILSRLDEYDLALDLRRHADTRFILVEVNARVKVGYEIFDARIDGLLAIKLPSERDIPTVPSRLNTTPAAKHMMDLVTDLPCCYNVFYTGSPPLIHSAKSSSRVSVGLFPFAGNDSKEWGTDKFGELASRLLRAREVDAVHVYVLNEAQRSCLHLPEYGRIVWHVGLSVLSLEESLSGISVCVANNSWGAHIAAKTGILLIGIYSGHETITEWAPVAPWSYVIHAKVECSPCHIPDRRGCPNNMRCLESITVDCVYDHVLAACRYSQNIKHPDRALPPFLLTRDTDDILGDLMAEIPQWSLRQLPEQQIQTLAQDIAGTFRPDGRVISLFVDISTIIHADAKTGIQRIVRALLREWLTQSWGNIRVEPVYAKRGEFGYRYARRWTAAFLGTSSEGLEDDAIEAFAGDTFIALDLHHTVPVEHAGLYRQWRERGIGVYFVVYDLLPVCMPHRFLPGAKAQHAAWLAVVAQADGALCISQSTADDFEEWLSGQKIAALSRLQVASFPLGHDIANSVPTRGLPDTAPHLLARLAACPTFLMVGTLEPRKAYAQTLAAFEQLWGQGASINLVIVGSQGWMVEALIDTLRSHKESGHRLFWLDGISDEYLDRIYRASRCLIAASEGEGFGLPLIEAAGHGLPIIARDIPVFREIGGKYATYFENTHKPSAIADAVQHWLTLPQDDARRAAHHIPHATWEDSARRILEIIGLSLPQTVEDDVSAAGGAA